MSVETLKRIDLGHIKEIFAKAGIEPARREPQQCILAAYYKLGIFDFDTSYKSGIFSGWDQTNAYWSNDLDQVKFRLGKADAEAAAKILGV